MSKKSKILCIILAVLFIISIIITCILGLNVGLDYAEGTSIVFDLKTKYDNKEIENIAKDIWKKEPVLVKKVEVYEESVLIKVKDASDEELNSLVSKVNEKYNLELTREDLSVSYDANVKLRDIIYPYIIPLIIATALIVVYYSIRYRGVKEIVELLLKIVASEGILYSIYAIARLPINSYTMPIAMVLYAGTVTYVTLKNSK